MRASARSRVWSGLRRWRAARILVLLVGCVWAGPGERAACGEDRTADMARARSSYPWTYDEGDDRLDARFGAPPGFGRVPVEPGSFAAFVRGLPLRPAGTAVVDFRGQEVRSADDPAIAGVVDIDVGTADLEQCADFVIRFHAEWQYGRGERDIGYRSAAGERIGYEAFLRSGRGARAEGHATFRRYLDRVFALANTGSLAREGRAVAFADVRPGDVLVMTGAPFGHAVLVLDVALGPEGRRALLLGQGYMPAQSFQVLRSVHGPWFVVGPEATEIATPLWRPFPVTALRRLP